MTEHREYSSGGVGRFKKLLAISATALIATVTLATPVWTMPTGPDSIRPGKNIGVFHNLDFVAAFGYEVGETLTIDVYRGPHKIATAFGPAVEVDEGLPLNGALEVNHGPEGPAVQGDCWENYTPDIIPGDRIVVTDAAGGTDEVLVDNITIDGEPREDLSTADTTDIILEGRAAFADGTPIPTEQLNSGEMRNASPRFRATPNTVERIPGTADGWRATYKAPYDWFQMPDPLTTEEQKQAILAGDHAMGYGHVAPLPPETQLVEGLGGGGPALGCEQAPKQSNAVTISDDPVINLASGSLNLSGTAMEIVSAVSVTLSDEDPNTADVTVDATGLTAGPGEKAWSAEFTREQVESLADGKLTAAGNYTIPDGTTTGANKQIQKDTLAPVTNVNLADDSDSGESNSDDLTKDDTPTLNGATEAGSTVKLLDGTTQLGQTTADSSGNYSFTAEALGNGVHSIKAMATDPAGNVGAESVALDVTIDTQAAVVNASPQGGLSNTAKNVELLLENAAQEEGTKIYFTLDGSTPQAIASQLYTGPINITQTRTLKYRSLDKAGNLSSTASQRYVIDTIAPRIIASSKSPAPNATGIALGTNVKASFNENVTNVSGATFKLRQGTTLVPATVTYSASTRSALLNPSANLARGTKYTVVLSSGIKDLAGNRLTTTSWSFTTR